MGLFSKKEPPPADPFLVAALVHRDADTALRMPAAISRLRDGQDVMQETLGEGERVEAIGDNQFFHDLVVVTNRRVLIIGKKRLEKEIAFSEISQIKTGVDGESPAERPNYNVFLMPGPLYLFQCDDQNAAALLAEKLTAHF